MTGIIIGKKKRLGLILLLVVFLSLGFLFIRVDKIQYDIQPKGLFADSRSIVTIRVESLNIFNLRTPFFLPAIEIKFLEGEENIEVLPTDKKNICRFKSKDKIGKVYFAIKIVGRTDSFLVDLPIFPAAFDPEKDGFPNQVRLNDEEDRTNFRKWFNMIALTQYYQKDDKWMDRDCAGLIRFCFREALKKHDNKWLEKKKFLYDINIPDVRKYNYPDVPILGQRVFRTNSNPFVLNDTLASDSVFCAFVEAKYLKDHNLVFIGKDLREALPGDVIFYLNDVSPKWPYHSMIYLGNEKIGKLDQKDDWVIYHTGPDEKDPGIVKKIRLSDLMKHPNKRWHPIETNQYFLGFYRWKILN
jgi:uncharacterized protein YfaT (DUF1175 family)